MFAPDAIAVVLPIVFLLNGLGYVMIVRIDLGTGHSLRAAPGRLDRDRGGRLRHSPSSSSGGHATSTATATCSSPSAVVLLLLPLVPHFGESLGGARLWVHIGSFSFQPVELAKVVLCIFFASYFAEKRELLTIPTARLGNRLVLDPRPLVPIVLAWGFAIAVMSLEHDIGFSAHALRPVHRAACGWRPGAPGTCSSAWCSSASVPTWRAVTSRRSTSGSRTGSTPGSTRPAPGAQLVQSWYALGSGGIGGSGLGLGAGAYLISIPQSDFIFAIIGEEMGLLGATMIVVAFLLLVGAGLRIAQSARSEFAKLTAVGLTLIIGFQAFFIMGGVLRLLPLTGITLPFVSYGGSALVANYVLVAILMRISDEGTAAADAAEQTQYEQDAGAASPAAHPGRRLIDQPRLSGSSLRASPGGRTSPATSKSRLVDEDRHRSPVQEREHQRVRGTAGEDRALGPAPQVELGEVDRTLPAHDPDRHHVDVEALEHRGHQLVGERARGRDPAEGVGERHRVLESDREGQLPAGRLGLAEHDGRVLVRQVDGDRGDQCRPEVRRARCHRCGGSYRRGPGVLPDAGSALLRPGPRSGWHSPHAPACARSPRCRSPP